MNFSKSLIPILKNNPSEAKIKSHKLMLRTGMIKQSSAGIYSWLPLGFKIMKIIYFIIFFLIPIISYASSKNEIKNRLKNTKNIYFKFIQKVDEKIEKGECKVSFPKKILCNYDDIHQKV